MKNLITTTGQTIMSARRPDRERFWQGFLASSVALAAFLLLSVNSLYGDQSDALFIDNSGNVGIGTNDPQYALQISNFAPGDRYIALTTDGGNKYKTGIKLWAWQKDYGFTIEHDEAKAGLNILRNYADGIKPDPVGKTAFFISTTSGNVGIGTNTPGFPLSFPNELGDKISLYGQSGNNFGLGIQGALLQIHTNDNNSDIAFGYGKSDSLTETMRIKGTGNVGIGTNDPQYALQISNFAPGDRYIALTTDGGNKYKTGIKLWAWQKDYGFTIEHDEAKGGLNILRNYADGIKPDPVGKTAFFIGTTSGNVGIGTTDPGNYKLNVNGNTTIQGTLVVKDLIVNGWQMRVGTSGNVGYSLSFNDGGSCYPIMDRVSDTRLKTVINSISTALAKVRQLRGVTYLWNQKALDYFTSDLEKTISAGPDATKEANRALWQKERDKRYKELSKTNVGVIAQEVEAVLPEAVITNEAGYKSVRYDYLIPLLIEALKEEDGISKGQSETIARQQAEIQRLTAASQLAVQQLNELQEVKQKLARLEAAMSKLAGSGSSGDHNELISSAEGSKSNPGNTLDSH